MGTGIGWKCKSCGVGETFMCGGGMMSLNEPEVVECSRDGSFGPAMKALLGDGIPDGWTVFRENVFYRCPGCDAIVPGGAIRIDDESGGWIVYHTKPGECPSCGEGLWLWSDRAPMSEDELLRRCEGYAREGCPECGGTDVEITTMYWD